jgi:hypothetical protein
MPEQKGCHDMTACRLLLAADCMRPQFSCTCCPKVYPHSFPAPVVLRFTLLQVFFRLFECCDTIPACPQARLVASASEFACFKTPGPSDLTSLEDRLPDFTPPMMQLLKACEHKGLWLQPHDWQLHIPSSCCAALFEGLCSIRLMQEFSPSMSGCSCCRVPFYFHHHCSPGVTGITVIMNAPQSENNSAAGFLMPCCCCLLCAGLHPEPSRRPRADELMKYPYL